MAMTRASDDARHVENHIAVEIEIELGSRLKQSKSRLRRNSSGVIHVRAAPRPAAGLDGYRPLSKILTKIIEGSLQVKKLCERGCLSAAPPIQEFFIPADGAGLTVQVCVPPWTGRRIKVWL